MFDCENVQAIDRQNADTLELFILGALWLDKECEKSHRPHQRRPR